MALEKARVQAEFRRYCLYADLKDLHEKTIPEIDRFEAVLDGFTAENEKTVEMLKRFDEVLLHKASRIDLHGVD